MKYVVNGSDLSSIADAIRTKGGTNVGLSFPDGFVGAIDDIPTGGGSTLITKSITANGTYDADDDDADGYSSVTVAVPSKHFTGTFTGSTTGVAMDVSIPYTGSGHPVAGIIYPSAGGNAGNIASLAQKNVMITYSFVQVDVTETPTYSGNTSNNQATVTSLYKYSDSDPTSTTSNRGVTTHFFDSSGAAASTTNVVRFKSATTMSVFIAGTSYGFKEGIEYTYDIIYSA